MKITDWIQQNDVGDIFNNKGVSSPENLDEIKI